VPRTLTKQALYLSFELLSFRNLLIFISFYF